ncbi:MAG: type IVB secretion system protein IcmH/DotU [Reyranellaceae bacterium]
MTPAANSDDPFAEPSAGERTVIAGVTPRPRAPAGPAAPPPQQPQQSAANLAQTMARGPGAAPIDMNDLMRGMGSALAAAAVPLLGLVARLRNTAGNVNVAQVRERVYRELHTFARAGREAGVPAEQLRAAHYGLSATVDDVVMNTPWGAHSDWRNNTMVNQFHKDTEGGERFYAYLAKLMEAPGANRNILLMFYECLSLGFEGRYRVRQRGHSEHATVREKVWQTLRGVLGPLERELSPEWKGANAPARGQKRQIPVWLVAAAAALLGFMVFMGLLFMLSLRAEPTGAKTTGLVPKQPINLPISARQPPPPPPPPQAKPSAVDKFRIFLEKEIAAKKVFVDEVGRELRITINFAEMFAPASATIRPELIDLLRRIGVELKTELAENPGESVRIVGHTDADPIFTAQFRNNLQLSKARADAATAILSAAIGDSSKLTSIGKADSEPVADNKTVEGKARNRRVEVILVRPE